MTGSKRKRSTPSCSDGWHKNVVILSIGVIPLGFIIVFKCSDCGKELEGAIPK